MPFDPILGGAASAGALLALALVASLLTRRRQPAVPPAPSGPAAGREVRRSEIAVRIALMAMPTLVMAGAGVMLLALSEAPLAHFAGAYLLTMLAGMLLLILVLRLKHRPRA